MSGHVVLGAALIGIGLAVAVVSWGKTIWREFIGGIDDGFDAEAPRQFPELNDEDRP